MTNNTDNNKDRKDEPSASPLMIYYDGSDKQPKPDRRREQNEVKTMMQVDGRSAYSLATTGSLIFGATTIVAELFPIIPVNWILLGIVFLFASQMVETWKGHLSQILIISLLLLNYATGGNQLYTQLRNAPPEAPQAPVPVSIIDSSSLPIPDVPDGLSEEQPESTSLFDLFVPNADAQMGGLPPNIISTYNGLFLMVGGGSYPVNNINGQWVAAVNGVWYRITYNDGYWWYAFGNQWVVFPGQPPRSAQWRW